MTRRNGEMLGAEHGPDAADGAFLRRRKPLSLVGALALPPLRACAAAVLVDEERCREGKAQNLQGPSASFDSESKKHCFCQTAVFVLLVTVRALCSGDIDKKT
eukprot:919395-Rhodomonas_salina.1